MKAREKNGPTDHAVEGKLLYPPAATARHVVTMPTTNTAERQAFVAQIRSQLDRLADEVIDRERSTGLSTQLEAELETDHRRAEALAARLGSVEAEDWDEVADELEQAITRLRLALAAHAADRRATTSEAIEPARAAVLEQIAAWQAFLEELVVQGHLAGMDMRDMLDTLARRPRDLRRFLRHTAVHPVAGTAEAIGDLRKAAVHAWQAATAGPQR